MAWLGFQPKPLHAACRELSWSGLTIAARGRAEPSGGADAHDWWQRPAVGASPGKQVRSA